jgi:hypothetical protein
MAIENVVYNLRCLDQYKSLVLIENVVYNLRCLDQYKSMVLMPLGN